MMKKIMRKLIFLLVLGTLFLKCSMPILAKERGNANADGSPVSEVFIEVVDHKDKVSVTVPTVFAFVVNRPSDTIGKGISVQDGTLYLPNVKVIQDGADLALEVSEDASLEIRNYSTTRASKDDLGNPNVDNSIREGMGVDIKGYIWNEKKLLANDWQAVSEANILDDLQTFKQYCISFTVGGVPSPFIFEDDGKGILRLDKILSLKENGLAKAPSIKKLELDLKIGGQLSQYLKSEESVKVGKVVWTAIPQ